ncbi:MAG: hypothetical protein KDJ41_06975 [Hyphomicrobiaceae bacterium]|nr:hypothetical protein [Hyphomicrobiaceae bacterium]
MRTLVVLLALGLSLAAGPADAGKRRPAAPKDGFARQSDILAWIQGYRAKRDARALPRAVRAMSRHGLFRDPDAAGLYIGFLAGVIADNQTEAETLIAGLFPMPPMEQVILIRAIAYSGLPEWKLLLGRFAERMPARIVLIKRYVDGKLKVLRELPLDASPAVIDAHWGYYYATGSYQPLQRIIQALSWSNEKSDVEKLTIASMAKWTLATNAQREKDVLDLLKLELAHQPKPIAQQLRQIIEAAETFETGRIRKEALAAIEDLKRRGPAKSKWNWARIGQTALALLCVGAGVTGHQEVAVPCVLTGAVSEAALKFWGDP